jgi:hypothetical protein
VVVGYRRARCCSHSRPGLSTGEGYIEWEQGRAARTDEHGGCGSRHGCKRLPEHGMAEQAQQAQLVEGAGSFAHFAPRDLIAYTLCIPY